MVQLQTTGQCPWNRPGQIYIAGFSSKKNQLFGLEKCKNFWWGLWSDVLITGYVFELCLACNRWPTEAETEHRNETMDFREKCLFTQEHFDETPEQTLCSQIGAWERKSKTLAFPQRKQFQFRQSSFFKPQAQWRPRNKVSQRLLEFSEKTMLFYKGTDSRKTTHQLGVSLNGGTPKWMVYNGKPY